MIFLFFIFGLIIGSFLNALIFRLATNRPISFDRSICPHCHHTLEAWDLVPILSFLFLGGRCRYCKRKISWQYPIVELITAASFGLLAYVYGSSITDINLWFKLVFASFFIVIAIYDLKHYLILDKVLVPAVVLAVVFSVINHNLLSGLFGALIISGFFGLQYFISSGRWIGFGDVKLGIFLGLVFGIGQGLMLLFISYLGGAIVGLSLVSAGESKLSGKLPFGTILGFSGIIMLLVGPDILAWYLKLIGF